MTAQQSSITAAPWDRCVKYLGIKMMDSLDLKMLIELNLKLFINSTEKPFEHWQTLRLYWADLLP